MTAPTKATPDIATLVADAIGAWLQNPRRPQKRFTWDGMLALADNAVAKIDAMGVRGVTGCTSEEIEAMATVLALTNATHQLRALAAAPKGDPK